MDRSWLCLYSYSWFAIFEFGKAFIRLIQIQDWFEFIWNLNFTSKPELQSTSVSNHCQVSLACRTCPIIARHSSHQALTPPRAPPRPGLLRYKKLHGAIFLFLFPLHKCCPPPLEPLQQAADDSPLPLPVLHQVAKWMHAHILILLELLTLTE
jgi:hypothetical protein